MLVFSFDNSYQRTKKQQLHAVKFYLMVTVVYSYGGYGAIPTATVARRPVMATISLHRKLAYQTCKDFYLSSPNKNVLALICKARPLQTTKSFKKIFSISVCLIWHNAFLLSSRKNITLHYSSRALFKCDTVIHNNTFTVTRIELMDYILGNFDHVPFVQVFIGVKIDLNSS